MKKYSFDKLPDIKDVQVEDDIRSKMPGSLGAFLKDALWDNLFVYSFANFAYLFIIVAGVCLAIVFGDIPRLIKVLVIVGICKGALVLNLIQMYNKFKKINVFPVITPEGVTHMITADNHGEKYIRLTTMAWKDVKKLRVYKNFATLEIKNIRAVKDDIGLAYIWSDNIETLKDQIIYLWKEALSAKPDAQEFYMYSETQQNEIESYINETFGQYEQVLHEIISPDIHLDIAMIPPQEGRDYYTLCTIGAGAYRMDIDKQTRLDYLLSEHSEYIIYLPSDWKLDSESFKDEKYYWPVRLLGRIARLPLYTDSWLCVGHSVGTEDGLPYTDDLPYNNSLLIYPGSDILHPKASCNLSSGKTVMFHQILPITQEELEFKEENKTTDLLAEIFPEGSDVIETVLNRIKL